jgi:hypothetical protein
VSIQIAKEIAIRAAIAYYFPSMGVEHETKNCPKRCD